MRGMILAAGRGTRMGSLTEGVPKPLLRVAGYYLIEYSIRALVAADVREIVINVSYRGEQIKEALGNGERYGASIQYSEEETALETGGGIVKALPLLGKDPFIVLSCDVVSDFPLKTLPREPAKLAHIVLVDNPSFHPAGDFSLEGEEVGEQEKSTLTYANIGIFRPELFAGCQPGYFRLGDLLKKAVTEKKVTGNYFKGLWHNLGSPAELQTLSAALDNPL